MDEHLDVDSDNPRNIAARGGYEGGQKINGRKRQAMVDTDGRALRLRALAR
ncbi:hypothetical protein [Rhodopila sp.]|uniref:hypothetical protein n=1 Tax=Rhodopila sp. TaxID=2480087 RepID=UPI003D146491